MLYEGTVQFVVTDDNGNDKTRKESVILSDCETFTEAESKLYDEYDTNQGRNGLDITAIKRSRLKEIANSRDNEGDCIFIADVCDTFTDDKGNEKENTYKIAFFSPSIDTAKNFIDQYLKQGYDMKLKSLTETKFVDVI